MDARGEQNDELMEENNNQDEEMQDVDTRSESNCVSLSDEDEQLMLRHDDELDLESIIMQKPLSEEEINELIQDLVGVESKAAGAQETLEKESLAKVENEVREELAKKLRGVELNKSVAAEMMTFKDVRESTLNDLELESSNLLEQLDGAGVELPKLYKMIESKVPSGCYTEAWRKRAHWFGTQVTKESFVHTHRPVRKRNGKLLEEGASGFLETKFADDGAKECLNGPSELEWSSLNKVFTEKKDEAVSFGSKRASVYLASTPQQAAVNEVEEIEEIDAGLAVENERELALTEKPKKNYIRVKEKDDINIDDRQLQLGLKRKIRKKSSKQQEVHRNISKEEMLLQRHNPNFHEHKTLLKENEEEKLTTKEVQHVPVMVQEPSPSPPPQTVPPPRLPKRFNRSRFVRRNCTRTAHQLTLISQGIRVGNSTVCGECGLVLAWEGVTTHLKPK